jgi:hypothetical protein
VRISEGVSGPGWAVRVVLVLGCSWAVVACQVNSSLSLFSVFFSVFKFPFEFNSVWGDF